MSSINSETVVSVLKDQIENYDQKTEVKEEGRIIQIADGIATVYGMDQAMYGELVIFETGVHGLVLNVERNTNEESDIKGLIQEDSKKNTKN